VPKFWKIALAVLGVLLLAVLALPFLIDVDRFRPMLQDAMSKALGRPVTIGKLRLAIMRGEIEADQIAIADDPAFGKEPFVSAEGLKVAVQVGPLIKEKKLLVDGVVLVKPKVALIQGNDLRWNFSTLAGGGKSAGESKPAAGTGGSDLDMEVKLVKLQEGTVTVKQAGGVVQGIVVEQLEAEIRDISKLSVMPVLVSGTIRPGGVLKLAGKVGPLIPGDVTMTPVEAQIAVEKLDLAESGSVPPTAAIKGVVDYAGGLMSKGGKAAMQGKLKIEKLQVGANAKPAGQLVELAYSVEHDLVGHRGVLNESELKAGKAAARFAGSYELRPQETALAMTLKGEGMPVDELLTLLPAFGVVLPQGASLRGGSLSVNAQSQGTTSRLSATGTVALNSTRLTGYSLSSKVSQAAALAGIKVGNDTVIQSFRTAFEQSPEMSKLTGIQMVVQDLGTLSGALTLDARQNLNGKLMADIQSSGGLTGYGMQKIGGSGKMTLNVPITISGTASQPVVTADTKAVAKQAVGEAASSAVQKYLPGKRGEAVGSIVDSLFGKKKKK